MPIDPSFLLRQQPVQFDPMAAAAKGLTLQELMNKNAQSQLLQEQTQMAIDQQNQVGAAMVNPRIQAALANASAVASGQPADPNAPSIADSLTEVGPLARMTVFQKLMEQQERGAKIGVDVSKAAEQRMNTYKLGVGILGNQAAGLADQQKPITDAQVQDLLLQAKKVDMPQEYIAALGKAWLAGGQDQGPLRDALRGAAASATSWKDQVDLQNTKALQPGAIAMQWAKVDQDKALAAEARMRTQLAPGELAVKQQNARTQALEQAFGKATLGVNDLGQAYTLQPSNVPGQAPTAMFAAGPPVGVTPGIKQSGIEAGQQLGTMSNKASAAHEMQTILQNMRTLDAQGLMAGGVMGQEQVQKLVNVIYPFLPKDTQNKINNTQIWSTEGRQVVAQAVSEFAGARVAARELPFFEGAKVSSTQQTAARAGTYNTLYNNAQRIIDAAQQAGEHLKSNVNLSNFAPKFQEVKMPDINLPKGVVPDPAFMGVGSKWTDDNGQVWKSNGHDWINTQTQMRMPR